MSFIQSEQESNPIVVTKKTKNAFCVAGVHLLSLESISHTASSSDKNDVTFITSIENTLPMSTTGISSSSADMAENWATDHVTSTISAPAPMMVTTPPSAAEVTAHILDTGSSFISGSDISVQTSAMSQTTSNQPSIIGSSMSSSFTISVDMGASSSPMKTHKHVDFVTSFSEIKIATSVFDSPSPSTEIDYNHAMTSAVSVKSNSNPSFSHNITTSLRSSFTTMEKSVEPQNTHSTTTVAQDLSDVSMNETVKVVSFNTVIASLSTSSNMNPSATFTETFLTAPSSTYVPSLSNAPLGKTGISSTAMTPTAGNSANFSEADLSCATSVDDHQLYGMSATIKTKGPGSTIQSSPVINTITSSSLTTQYLFSSFIGKTKTSLITVEPRFNEVPRDSGNWFIKSRFFSIHFTINWHKNVVRYAEDLVI